MPQGTFWFKTSRFSMEGLSIEENRTLSIGLVLLVKIVLLYKLHFSQVSESAQAVKSGEGVCARLIQSGD